MAIKDLIVKKNESGLSSVEMLTIAYSLLTSVLIAIHWNGLPNPVGMITLRAIALGAIAVTNLIYRIYPCKLGIVLRCVPMLLLLIQWYPETYEFCSQYPYLDHLFAQADQTLFGCQPAFEFRKLLSTTFWSEAFNMGYYAYYYMMVLTVLFYLFFRYSDYEKASFIFLGSFFVFYLIYDLLPVAGPQYYFCAVGTEAAQTGIFPEIGYYFQTNTEMLKPEIKGIFSQLVVGAQEVGERPTAAFPSSHVGMSTVTMMLAWQTRNKWLFWVMVPFYLLLCCATVYIQAHYLVDSIAGFFSAIIIFIAMDKAYPLAKRAFRLKD
ncbi:MAG: phosphatase PAP2 family protein [Bacteroidaceae bacterium]|nr:phosphatase PAP2 family protein [Bacteroidaceae bacterium]